jgi:hypothetical protein
MQNFDRRTLLIGSGAALALAALHDPGEARPVISNHNWNSGDDPWSGHPANSNFNPEWVCILYIELMPNFAIKGLRFHHRIALGANNWIAIKTDVLTWINQLNANVRHSDIDRDRYTFYGLKNIKFHNPHHVIVYIKNSSVEFTDRPIWFGDLLQGTVKDYNNVHQIGPGPATKNRSFFNTAIYENISEIDQQGGPFANKLIHFENHLHKREQGRYRRLDDQEERVYSLNINVVGKSLDQAGQAEMDVPIIIDPDTGNMGGGYPFLGFQP